MGIMNIYFIEPFLEGMEYTIMNLFSAGGGLTGSIGGTQPPQGGFGPGHGCGQSEQHLQQWSSVQSVSQHGGLGPMYPGLN